MNEQNSAELIRLGPNLYSRGEPTTPFALFHFEVGDGWFELLKKMTTKVESELAVLPPHIRGTIRASQVKEKFGGLRFYMDGLHDNTLVDSFVGALKEAEDTASITCETCGNPGVCRSTRGWISVTCDTHFEELKKLHR